MFKSFISTLLARASKSIHGMRISIKNSKPFIFITDVWHELTKLINTALSESMAQYVVWIVLAIGFSIVFRPFYENVIRPLNQNLPPFLATDNNIDFNFIGEFLQWFGVLYGFLLPLILVRVWELFDEIDNVFDREADAIKILAEDMLLLRDNLKDISTSILKLLLTYTVHVRIHHAEESFLNNSKEDKPSDGSKKDKGADYLRQIREQYKLLIHQPTNKKQEINPLISELLDKLNTIIDLRGDRISLSTQRLFESLKPIAIITTILWVVPLFFLLSTEIGLLNRGLIVLVIFLVVTILSIIDDMDKPFEGYWRVTIESWDKLTMDLSETLKVESAETFIKILVETNGDVFSTDVLEEIKQLPIYKEIDIANPPASI